VDNESGTIGVFEEKKLVGTHQTGSVGRVRRHNKKRKRGRERGGGKGREMQAGRVLLFLGLKVRVVGAWYHVLWVCKAGR